MKYESYSHLGLEVGHSSHRQDLREAQHLRVRGEKGLEQPSIVVCEEG